MDSVLYNGSMIGITLDFSSTEQYVIGTTQQRSRPTLVGSQTYNRAGSTTATAVGFSLTEGSNSVPQEGDVVVLAVALSAAATTLITAPSGYTSLASLVASDTYDSVLWVGYKIMGPTPDTTFPVPSAISTSNSQMALVYVWRGVDQTTPIDVTTTTSSDTNSRLANPSTITPVTENAIVMAVGAAAYSGTVYSFSAGGNLSGFVTVSGSDTYDGALGMGYNEWISGAFDPTPFSITGTTTSDSWTTATLALRPALTDVPVYGNYKNSGIWNLQSAFQAVYENISSVPSFVGVSSVSAGFANSLVLNVPTHLAGDLLLAFMVGSFSGASDWTQANWTQLYDRSGNGGPAVFYKIASSSEPGSYTFSQTNNNTYSGAIAVFRNAQVDVVGAAAVDSDPLVAPSITVSQNNSILVGFYTANSASRAPSTPTGMSNIIMDNNATAPSFGVFTQTVNLGATGTRSSTIGTASATTGILLSLKSSG